MEGVSLLEQPAPAAANAAASEAANPDRPPLIAWLGDAKSEQVLREALLEGGAERVDVRRGGIAEATRQLGRSASPRVLIVDVAGHDQPLGALEELAQVCEPDTRVLVVGEREDIGFYRTLTQGLSVSEYLFKPLTRELLARVFLPHVGIRPPAEPILRGGRVVVVTGARGGVGTTTIATSLAVHLSDGRRAHVALVDLDPFTGSAALMLGLSASPGLRTVLETPAKVDILYLERAAQAYGERLRVFAAEEKFSETLAATEDGVDHLIGLLRQRFNYVVIDAPSGYPPLVRHAFAHAHQRVLVMAPDLANARDLLRLHALPSAPAQARRGVVVLNQASRPGALNQKQVEAALELKPDIVVPFLPKLLPATL
ncbi:MAG: AAA family ATPase, partial [Acetobacteraceae bacterium]|nr:AAA family ATPase [Acetobacteraceae bacterium]